MFIKARREVELRGSTHATTIHGDGSSNFYTSTSALSRGALKRKKNRNTIHFTAESSNVKLLFRIIHSANQLSIYGAVPRNTEEVNSLVDSARAWYAFGNKKRDDLHDMKILTKTTLDFEEL